MKVIILAGGLGTRISEETDTKPKPMILIDNRPILWHIMNIYAIQGFHNFIVAAGYKSEIIHKWVENQLQEEWDVKVLDTGLETQTAGRLAQCMELAPNERMMATYGDGLGNINISKLISFHEKMQCLSTVTAVRPPSRFGVLESINGKVVHFGEKIQTESGWINGGFFVLEPGVKKFLTDDNTSFEINSLPELTKQNQLAAFEHNGFWHPMDTIREKNLLSSMIQNKTLPWTKFS
jgi:glucose-1-phosphate cytidylyltransferase